MGTLDKFITAFYSELPTSMDRIHLDATRYFIRSLIEAMDDDTRQYALDYMDVYLFAYGNPEMVHEKLDAAAKLFLLFTFNYKTPV